MRADHWRRGFVVLAALAVGLVLPGSALAGARAGARYDGRSANGQPVFVQVSKDGRRLARYLFVTRQRCSDGKRHTVGLASRGEGPTAVNPDGSFQYTSKPRRRGTLEFEGRFDAAGNTVTGSLNAVFRSRRFTCRSGEVTFTLHRDGTAGAPYRDARVASGLYLARGRSLTLHLRALLPGRLVHTLGARYPTRCASGKTRRVADQIAELPLTRRGGFAARLVVPLRGKGGLRVSHRVAIAGKFLYAKGAYRLAGAIKTRDVLRRGGQVVDVCRTPTLPFAGTFKRGPLGEEGPHPAG